MFAPIFFYLFYLFLIINYKTNIFYLFKTDNIIQNNYLNN